MTIVGIDLDNTIIDYTGVFHRHAVARGLIPASVPTGKDDVRDYLRGQGRDDLFTELQGFVYGPGLSEARPYAGIKEAWANLHRHGAVLYIVSHKTPRPFRGPPYDLPQYAREWLSANGFIGNNAGRIPMDAVFLEPTKEAKLARIRALRCDWFIDDLPEFLAEPEFPETVRRILFDPNGRAPADDRWLIARDWQEVGRIIIGDR